MKTHGWLIVAAATTAIVSAQGSKTVLDGVYSEAQATRGKALYITHCASCHQEGLQGADLAPALKGEDFILRWVDHPMQEMVERVATTMPQDAPNSLKPQETVDIVAYMLQVNRYPAGSADLATEAATLKTITFARGK
jgi:quinoprotein glucose dehydrogenase